LAAQAKITCQLFEIQQKLEPLHIWRHNHHWKGKKTKQLFAKIRPSLILFNITAESIQALPTETLTEIASSSWLTLKTFLQTAKDDESLHSLRAYTTLSPTLQDISNNLRFFLYLK